MSLKNKLTGTGVAIITPFKKNKEVDYDALGNLIDHIIKSGVEYIVTLGTTGETPTLSKKGTTGNRKIYNQKIDDRVPVVIGIGGNNTSNVIESLSDFSFEKITAVLSSSPSYNKPSQEGIYPTLQSDCRSLTKTNYFI